ncbi:uncharacterized protein LOC131687689 [Topomyia yanbarensis]|uniref:uncharacterized protein LOC131687689 n=1 Tax=Topomyia yanbarensis TaxID=2498891 RepID=UPI00273AE849|nr:uncharacterized protein LOC131687689 [Topomyia yanbarensis]
METGLCQGSVLSVTLFLIAIDTITQFLPNGVFCLIYADDVILVAEGIDYAQVEAKLQNALDAITEWETQTGFKISAEKCATVIFKATRARKISECKLQKNGVLIPRNSTHKCLGVKFDQSLTFQKHVEEIRAACKQRLQFLRCVANRSWGGDSKTITKLYKATILEKILYAAPIIASVQDSTLRKLDTLHNTGLRAISGAFQTSPIESLHVAVGIPNLRTLLQQRTAMFAAKMKACEDSSNDEPSLNERSSEQSNVSDEELTTDSNGSSGELWGTPKPKHETELTEPARIRGNNILEELGLKLPLLNIFTVPKSAPWKRTRIAVDKSLLQPVRQGYCSAVIQQLFHRLKLTRYRIHRFVFTDGSRKDNKSEFSVITDDVVIRRRIDDMSSIYAAESEAAMEALSWVANQDGAGAYLICTDSLSVVTGLETLKITSRWRDDIGMLYNHCKNTQKDVTFCWVPSHIGIAGNERADREAKAALEGIIDTETALDYKEMRRNITKRTVWKWQEQWQSTTNNKLCEVKNAVTPYIATGKTRRENVVLTRLRIGHTSLTHKFLLERDEPPKCRVCNERLTVKHIIAFCPGLEDERRSTGLPTSMREALADDDASINIVIEFFKKTGYFESI